MGPKTPTNLDLAREAMETPDCKRQTELATHPSGVVRRALSLNAALCKSATAALGSELDLFRAAASKRLRSAAAVEPKSRP